MKFSTLLLFSIEVFSLLVKAHPLDFTSTELSPRDVDQYTLKTKDYLDSREVKLFVSMYEDGFESVSDGNVRLWGDDKNYKCTFAKVYFKDERALGVKLAFHLKDPGYLAVENSKISFLGKVGDKWFVVDRKQFWELTRKIFDVNYAHEGHEFDEEFDVMRPTLDVARPPSNTRRLHKESPLKPNFPFPSLPEATKELKADEGKEPVPRKPSDKSEKSHPMSEMDNLPGPNKGSSEREVKESGKRDESVPMATPGVKKDALRLRKKQDEKTVVSKDVKKENETNSFLTNSLLLPGIIMMFYSFS